MDFIDEEIQQYVEAHSEKESEHLAAINRDTNAHVLYPRMLSGHLQGRILSMISYMIAPKTILEIGTYTGYSALCLAEGLVKDGKIVTIDVNEELEDRVRQHFAKSQFENQIDYRIGNALEEIPTLNETFDLVFIDADKLNYSKYFELVLEKVSVGGFIVADNVLWSGKVVEDSKKSQDADTKALIEFNLQVHNDKRVQNVLLPVRDGLMILRKL